MILIRRNITEQYSQYRLDHLLFRFGENDDINHDKSPNIEISYCNSVNSRGILEIKIFPNAIKPDITGYLKVQK